MSEVLKLGPDGYNKIAILGSAPSSVRLAPYGDQSWAMWGCSPGVYGVAPRTEVWFEIHRWEPSIPGEPNNPNNKPWFSPEYVAFMERHAGTVFLAGPDAEIERPVPSVKNGHRFPFEDYIAKYSPYFFTSSMAWMLVHAIEQLAPRAAVGEKVAIGLWGVDMAASSEYAFQRPGCQHFIGLARKLGIEVVLPPESDLMQPPTLYGISEYHPRHTKLLARLNEMEQQKAHWTGVIANAQSQLAHITGAADNMRYIFNTWIDDIDPGVSITSAVSLAGVALSRPEAEVAALERFDPEPRISVDEAAAAPFGHARIKAPPKRKTAKRSK